MKFNPYDSMNDWNQCCTTQLADAQRYYEKWQIDKMLEDIIISGGGVTSGQVQEMIDESTSATTEEVNELAIIVSGQTEQILDRYTKEETNDLLSAFLTKLEAKQMFGNYSKVENTTLILNSENHS
jgi:Tfp pilus assembly PilM family ATPase